MLIISRTPVRISLFGGGTDYPAYYTRKPGAVLGFAIDKYTHVSVGTLSEFFDHKIRIGYSKTELVKEVEEIQHPSIRECLRFMKMDRWLDIHIFSDLPARTGLGSSSSFTVGFLNALYALQGKQVSKQQLAEEACFIEQQLIRENVGSQDQFHAAFGGINMMQFTPDGIVVRPVILSRAKREALESHLMVFYTGLTRWASEVVKEQIQNTAAKLNDPYLEEMSGMVKEAEEVIIHAPEEEMGQQLGKLLHRGWELKKRLSTKVTNPSIDQAYQKALAAGAYGGKLCGAGSGGFLALFVKPALHDAVRKALDTLLEVKFKIDNSGSTIIYMKD
jgi:D-glycero-alpha-D-manno-heptose-7-phosphate kinase